MSRDRFKYIWQARHFLEDETKMTDSKTRPIVTYRTSKILNVLQLQAELLLHKSIMPSRLFFKVSNASKIIKYVVQKVYNHWLDL